MLGWLSAPIAFASRSNRASDGGSLVRDAGRTLIATSRPSRASCARYTSPMPPEPMGPVISYAPRRVPVERLIRSRDYKFFRLKAETTGPGKSDRLEAWDLPID